jgi:hypothetical protein
MDIADLVMPDSFVQGSGAAPDFYVVGLQEMVDLEVIGSIICAKDKERMVQWESIVGSGLKKRTGQVYGCLLRKVMFGCFVMLFVRQDNFKYISNMHSVKTQTGTKGLTANKGSTAIRFNFHDTSFMFMNCHLTSGQKKIKERISDLDHNLEETLNYFVN